MDSSNTIKITHVRLVPLPFEPYALTESKHILFDQSLDRYKQLPSYLHPRSTLNAANNQSVTLHRNLTGRGYL